MTSPDTPDEWPKLSVVIGGSATDPLVKRTVRSVEAGDYAGSVQVLMAGADEHGTAAALANEHVAEASGRLLMVLRPGVTLDPACLRRLVERMIADDSLAAVVPGWRCPDGTPLTGATFVSVDPAVRRVLGDGPAEPPYPLDLTGEASMLMRTRRFFAVGGFDLALDGTPYLGADLARRLCGEEGHMAVEPAAVAFVPTPPSTLRRMPAYRAVTAGVGDSPPAGRSPRHRILWAGTHLPDRDRSGIDARQVACIAALRQLGHDVVMWAEHDSGSPAVRRSLARLGVEWIAPPPEYRWESRTRPAPTVWFRDMLDAARWDTVVVGEPRLASWIVPAVRSQAPGTPIVVDLGTTRFPDTASSSRPPRDETPDIAGADAVMVACPGDAAALRRIHPGLPSFVFGSPGGLSGRGGGSAGGPLLFVGDLFHRPNLLALEWWMDAIAARVESKLGHPMPLRVVGHGADAHRAVWNHPNKLDIAGWRPDLDAELAAARILVVPLTIATGTGGRIAAALSRRLPVVCSTPAAAILPPALAELVHIGADADGLAEHISRLMNAAVWENDRENIAAAGLGAFGDRQTNDLGAWLETIATLPPPSEPASRIPRTRRGLRRLHPSS